MPTEARRPGNGPAAPDPEQAEDEQRMRRALGLGGPRTATGTGASRSSGSPVVVHRNGRSTEPPVNRIAEAQAALAAERLAREQAEAALRNAEAALKESETRRGHAELTRDEAVAALAEERAARQAAEERLRELTEPPPPAEPAQAPRRRGRPPKVPRQEVPETNEAPVEWWVPGWKTRLSGAR
jgi:hypothetical protein